MISTRSTGFDHIDIKEARKRRVNVSNVPVYGENPVAEHPIVRILSLSRNLRKAYFKTRDANFSIDGLMGFDLKGKVLSVVGTGHIGLHVIHIARGFGLEVAAFDVRQNHFLAEFFGFRYASLDELFAQADIISLHIPCMPSTHHMVNCGNLSKIKRGAGLDVLEGEDMILEEKRLLENAESQEHWEKMQLALKNKVLLNSDNVIFTQHMAFYSKEAVMRILDTTLSNIRSFLSGSPENTVNA